VVSNVRGPLVNAPLGVVRVVRTLMAQLSLGVLGVSLRVLATLQVHFYRY